MRPAVTLRIPEASEIAALAKLWFDGWQDAHAAVMPAALTRLRTQESFVERLPAMLAQTRVAGDPGAPLGFCTLKHDELDQLFVAPAARGTGLAAALVADAERRLAAHGVATGWLACAIGNHRAARFYEKCGWHLAGTVAHRLETTEGPFDLEIWRYEKQLLPAS
ncbi:GNAT family N-acetyltransferase [Shinella sp. G-2]|uniref:GNAT family N-acetyltransferase n=1 Tax=Shinella sp. G-2 TaxID=3133141 RepID=UPI003D005A3D